MSEPPASTRAPRADAARNRAKLLDAAKAVFAAGGADVSLEAVARRAELGVGTLYRHFPTREALYEAVYRREVDELSALAARLQSEAAPEAALRTWVAALVDFVATKKGMATALALAAHDKSLTAYSFEHMTSAVRALLDRLKSEGGLRRSIAAEDFLRALIGIMLALDGQDWRGKSAALIDVFIDGLVGAERD